MESQNKPLPPFGAILNQYLQTNLKIKFKPWVFCGKDAWQEAMKSNEYGQIAICLPSGKEPNDFTWPVNDLSLIIYHTGGLPALKLSKLAFELIQSGARQVTIYCEYGNELKIYNR